MSKPHTVTYLSDYPAVAAFAGNQLKNLNQNAKPELKRLSRSHAIVVGIARQLLEHDDANVRARARMIIHTLEDSAQVHEQLLR